MFADDPNEAECGEQGLWLHITFPTGNGPKLPPVCTELCDNIPAKFEELVSKCSNAQSEIALLHYISASHSRNLA